MSSELPQETSPSQPKYALGLVVAGLVMLLAGLGWDAVLHEIDPGLAEREGVFTITNPSHLMVLLGIGLAIAGVIWLLVQPALSGGTFAQVAVPIVISGLIVVLAGGLGGFALATGGLTGAAGGGHPHGDEEVSAAEPHGEGQDEMDTHPASVEEEVLLSLSDSSQVVFSELTSIVDHDGTEVALARLQQLSDEDPAVLGEAHNIVHNLGRYSYEHYDSAQEAFTHCDQSFESGCFHGVMEGWLQSNPDFSNEEIADICSGQLAAGGVDILRYNCLHGLGHGLTFFYNHDIFQALGTCDALRTQWENESCYGGVFMENIVFAMQPADSDSHAHGGDTSEHETFLDPNDPLYPCNAVAERYQGACYFLQTSAILNYNNYDYAAAFLTCDTVPAQFVTVCYQSMGRDISGATGRDVAQSIELCSAGTAQYRDYCFMGVAKNLIDLNWETDKAFDFCGQSPEDVKALCYRAIGEQVAVLYASQAEKDEECARSEDAYVDECRDGVRTYSTGTVS